VLVGELRELAAVAVAGGSGPGFDMARKQPKHTRFFLPSSCAREKFERGREEREKKCLRKRVWGGKKRIVERK